MRCVLRAAAAADEIAAEISREFHLSDTDMDICAAALKEWLDRGMSHDCVSSGGGGGGH